MIAEISHIGADGKRTWMYAAISYYEEMASIIVHPGESYVKENGKWQDWTETEKDLDYEDDAVDNFGIKAFYRE